MGTASRDGDRTEARRVWVIRAGRGGEIIDTVESRRIAAIGWREMGDCSSLGDREDFRRRYREVYAGEQNVGGQSGQVFRFIREVRVGDMVLTPDRGSREILVGEATGEYRYDPEPTGGAYPQVRDVRWRGRLSRDQMTPKFRASLGNIGTLFTIVGCEGEVERLLARRPPAPDDGHEAREEEEVEPYDFLAETESKAAELIADMLARVPWDHFEQLVAAVLRALGYRTRLTRRGPDGGYDVVAHPDALGFEQPRIRAEVKHRKAAMGAPDVRAFRSTIGPEEKGVYVSTGGFTADALREPEKAGPSLVLLDRDEFVALLLENYEALEPEFKAMLPLKKVYIPTEV